MGGCWDTRRQGRGAASSKLAHSGNRGAAPFRLCCLVTEFLGKFLNFPQPDFLHWENGNRNAPTEE